LFRTSKILGCVTGLSTLALIFFNFVDITKYIQGYFLNSSLDEIELSSEAQQVLEVYTLFSFPTYSILTFGMMIIVPIIVTVIVILLTEFIITFYESRKLNN